MKRNSYAAIEDRNAAIIAMARQNPALSFRAIGEKFGVSGACVSQVISGKRGRRRLTRLTNLGVLQTAEDKEFSTIAAVMAAIADLTEPARRRVVDTHFSGWAKNSLPTRWITPEQPLAQFALLSEVVTVRPLSPLAVTTISIRVYIGSRIFIGFSAARKRKTLGQLEIPGFERGLRGALGRMLLICGRDQRRKSPICCSRLPGIGLRITPARLVD
jgi:hypothetical protein